MKRVFVLTASTCLLLSACKFEVKGPNDKQDDNKIGVQVSTSSTNGVKIRNDIQLESSGVKVDQAFLSFEDGKLVPETNVTEVGKPIKLRLIIDKGWKEQQGTVAIGASETIETSDGDVLLDEKDLFKDYTSISPADSKYISLTASISRLNKLYDYFLVKFRVWDKNGSGEVKGSYKFYIQ